MYHFSVQVASARAAAFNMVSPLSCTCLASFILVAVPVAKTTTASQKEPPKPGSLTLLPLYPYYNQCSPLWAGDTMGLVDCTVGSCGRVGRDTICNEGCALSCVSMALAAYRYKIGGEKTTPKTLNSWLVENAGYECLGHNCNNMVLKQVEKLASDESIRFEDEVTSSMFNWTDLVQRISSGLVVIAHVRNRTHFVLIDGQRTAGVYTVLDPLYSCTEYNISEISDVIVYKMKLQDLE